MISLLRLPLQAHGMGRDMRWRRNWCTQKALTSITPVAPLYIRYVVMDFYNSGGIPEIDWCSVLVHVLIESAI